MPKVSDYTCNSIIDDKTAIEAGYVNNPNDRGGETNFGITIALATFYKSDLVKRFGWNGRMVNLTKQMAYWLYKVEFWDKIKGDELLQRHPLIADKMFDFSINAGKKAAVEILQTYLTISNRQGKLYPDCEVDGAIGKDTLTTLDAYIKARGEEGIARLLFAFICEQGSHYNDITVSRMKNEEFIYGWYGRAQEDMIEYNRVLGLA